MKIKPYGPRGVAMLALAVLCYGRAVAYLQPASPTFTPALLLELSGVFPVALWGFLWGATGIYLTVAAFTRSHAGALAAVTGMSILWAGLYVYAAATRVFVAGFQASLGAWITATVYLALAVIIMCLARMVNLSSRRLDG